MKKAIVNAQVYDQHSGTYLPGTTVFWIDGVIEQVGDNIDLPSDTEVLDGQGCYVTPGLIDSYCQLGLKEAGIRWEGDDSHEIQDALQEKLDVMDGIYPFDQDFQDARANGVTTVHVAPSGDNVLSGTTSIIRTSGTVIDEMTVKTQQGLAISLGELPKRLQRDRFQTPMTRMGTASLLRETFRKVKYQEAMADSGVGRTKAASILQQAIFHHAPVYARVHRQDDICTALRLKEEFDLNLTLVHATEAHMVLEQVKEAKVAVFAGPFFLDRARYELRHITPQTSFELWQQDIPFSLITDHPTSSIRNLGLEVALAVRAGVPLEQAIHAVTLGAAQLLGIDDRYGSIEKGKQADLVLWQKEPFELTSIVEQTILAGEVVYDRKESRS